MWICFGPPQEPIIMKAFYVSLLGELAIAWWRNAVEQIFEAQQILILQGRVSLFNVSVRDWHPMLYFGKVWTAQAVETNNMTSSSNFFVELLDWWRQNCVLDKIWKIRRGALPVVFCELNANLRCTAVSTVEVLSFDRLWKSKDPSEFRIKIPL